jgi:hypothetical protein
MIPRPSGTGSAERSSPAVCRIVGDEFFRAMARAYFVSERRTSPILLDYGSSNKGWTRRPDSAAGAIAAHLMFIWSMFAACGNERRHVVSC